MERGGAATLEATRSWRGNGGAIYHPWEFRAWSWIFLWRRGGGLLAIHENQPYAAHFDQIPVIELRQRADFRSVDLGHEVPTAQVVAVLVLVDLRRNIRREPAAEPDGRHLRTPDHGQFPDQPVFFLVRAPAENGKRRNAQTIRGELRALTGGHCLFEHLAPLASIKHHRFVHARGRCFVPCVLDKSDIMRLVHEDMMLSDQDGVAVLEHGTLDAYVVQKGPIEAVQVFDHQRSRFQIFRRSSTPSGFARMRNTITLTLSTPPFSLARSTSRSAAFCADVLVRIVLAISGSVTMRDNPSEHSNNESPASNICSSASTSTFSCVPTARVSTLCISLASASCGVRIPIRTFSATREWSAVSWSSVPALSR